jgi:hypothetical protein
MLSKGLKAAQRSAARACVADLRASGEDLARPGAAAALVREHLDYFQLMIVGSAGVECPARRILALLRAELRTASLSSHRIH